MERERKKPGPKPKRPPRVPMGAGLSLAYPEHLKDPDYYYYWFQDRDGRIQEALDAWYEPVKRDGKEVVVQSGQYPLRLMRLPMEHYRADQKLHLQEARDKIKSVEKLEEDEYLPDDRHHVIQKDTEYDPLA